MPSLFDCADGDTEYAGEFFSAKDLISYERSQKAGRIFHPGEEFTILPSLIQQNQEVHLGLPGLNSSSLELVAGWS